MDIYKYINRYFVLPLWAKWERTQYLKHLKHLEKSQYFTEEKIKDYQWEKIKKLLDHAYKNCEYYRDKFNEKGVHPRDIKSFDDFSLIPILKKEDVNKYNKKLIAPNMDKYAAFLTSGSTGKPLKGYRNKDCQEFKRACNVRSSLWAGYKLGERVYVLYGNPEKELSGIGKAKAVFRRKFLKRAEVLDLLQLCEESMLKFADKMLKYPPSLIYGHAHGLYTLARFFEKKGIKDIRPKGIYSAGMVLHKFEREKVEKVFNCKFQDRYGCEELGLIASECKKCEGLHINTDGLYVEFLDKKGKPVLPGEPGNIIITDLSNYVMPFIRYKLEDVCITSPEPCSCGRTQPLIKKIEGRIADFLVTPDNKLVSGISLTDHFAGHIPGVAQIQIIQEQIDLIIIKIVRNNNFNEESQQQIDDLVKDFFGSKMHHECRFVDEIPKEASGKFRFTICKVEHELL